MVNYSRYCTPRVFRQKLRSSDLSDDEKEILFIELFSVETLTDLELINFLRVMIEECVEYDDEEVLFKAINRRSVPLAKFFTRRGASPLENGGAAYEHAVKVGYAPMIEHFLTLDELIPEAVIYLARFARRHRRNSIAEMFTDYYLSM